MFIDEATIFIKAGKGGDGVVSFRKELFIPKGGPDGGDGGDGGSVVFKVDSHCHGLAQFNRVKDFYAQDGQNGMSKRKKGKNGQDLVLLLPPGTEVYENDKLIADLIEEGREIVVVRGGNGGWGNHHFATSVKQTPRWAKNGLEGDQKRVRLELKTIADVGLIGLPNSGKSTLLKAISNASPKIADYPFTTLEPNLGVVKNNQKNIIIADIPGLIEGAHQGRGLGDKFLRHIERTRILVHLIDINSSDIVRDYEIIRNELKRFSKKLIRKKEIVVLSKADTIENVTAIKIGKKVEQATRKQPIIISLVAHKNIDKLLQLIEASI